MMNEKIFAEEILLDEELEKVSGGTVKELEDLSKAVYTNPTLKKIIGVESHFPIANGVMADQIEKLLQDDLKIDANISVGFLGTGAGSKNNIYRDMTNGQYISHQDVLNRISRYVA